MTYYAIKPEVAGGFGDGTEFIERTTRPPGLAQFHYEINTWAGDDLLTTVGCYIASTRLIEAFSAAKLTGWSEADVKVSVSDQFHLTCPGKELPSFRWLKVHGKPLHDDFAFSDARLVVSQRALDICAGLGAITHAEVKPKA